MSSATEKLCYPERIKKRDGTVENFNEDKLEASIWRVLHHLGKDDRTLAHAITAEVCTDLGKSKVVDTERVRRAVRRVFKDHKIKGASDFYELVFLHFKSLKIKKVAKRDGTMEKFDPYKIFKSLRKSFASAGIEDGKKCEMLTKEVVKLLERKYAGKTVPVETIKQDVEFVLVKHRLAHVAKAYILYRFM